MRRMAAVKVLVAILLGAVGVLGTAAPPGGAQAATPAITVTPSTGLVEGQQVQVDGTAFPASSVVGFLWCRVGGGIFSGGCVLGIDATSADADGAFSYAIPARECGVGVCEVVATALVDGVFGPEARYPVSFAGIPTLTVTVGEFGTADDAGLGVVSAWIACDVPTPIEASADITQIDAFGWEGAIGSFTFTDECTPGEPVHGFFPTRDRDDEADDPFVPGAVLVWVSARPPGQPSTTATRDPVTLFDREVLVAAIQEALLDPANTELRAAVLAAIHARVRQDPVFAAEWRATARG